MSFASRYISPGLLVAGLAATFLPAQAFAYGFTGSFAPQNWKVYNYLNDPGFPVGPSVTPTSTTSYPAYICGASKNLTCVDAFDANKGEATLIGSNDVDLSSMTGNGVPNESWVTQWTLDPYTGVSPYQLTFNWSYFTQDGTSDDQPYYFTVDPGPSFTITYYPLSSTSGNTGTESVSISSGMGLGFGVHTVGNTGGAGYLTVEQFNPVPGPLPILGVAAAFRWTRRLRKRQRDSQSSYKL
jgi:hypothetical protein